MLRCARGCGRHGWEAYHCRQACTRNLPMRSYLHLTDERRHGRTHQETRPSSQRSKAPRHAGKQATRSSRCASSRIRRRSHAASWFVQTTTDKMMDRKDVGMRATQLDYVAANQGNLECHRRLLRRFWDDAETFSLNPTYVELLVAVQRQQPAVFEWPLKASGFWQFGKWLLYISCLGCVALSPAPTHSLCKFRRQFQCLISLTWARARLSIPCWGTTALGNVLHVQLALVVHVMCFRCFQGFRSCGVLPQSLPNGFRSVLVSLLMCLVIWLVAFRVSLDCWGVDFDQLR